ncbi:AAA family ATPase [Cumulibacter soli]|uniref:cytidylate kinase-like family protein n=1 Tax=Cumulibacter soli TaxID=2546344 RepID=UPI001068BE3A|nr:cytidylate kinase-like family protein [Cumulibacter soli]
MTVITVSTAFGVRGSHIGSLLAQRLSIPFVDRAVPRTVSRELGIPMDDVLAQDNRAATGLWRLISAMAVVPDISGTEVLAQGSAVDERKFIETTERVMRSIAAESGGVFVGRAGAVVLRDFPEALHVRLTGARERRIEAFAASKKLSVREAAETVDANDKARLAYGKTFYRTNLADAALYDLVIDQTRLTETATVEILQAALSGRVA